MTASTTKRRWWLSALLALVSAAPADAARPLQTEDAGIIEARDCEIEGGRLIERGGDDGKTGITGGTFACGIGLDTQLAIGTLSARGPDGGLRAYGIGGKTGLWSGEGDRAPALTLAYSLDWSRPDNGSTKLELSHVRLVGTIPVPGASVHLNLGHLREHDAGRSATFWGLALESEPLPAGPLQWQPMIEGFGIDTRESWVNAGLRFTLMPARLFVDVAYARRMDSEKTSVLTAGFKFSF